MIRAALHVMQAILRTGRLVSSDGSLLVACGFCSQSLKRGLLMHRAEKGRIQSRNSQVSAPSKRLTSTDASSAGSKFRRFTPWRAPGLSSIGSQ